MKIAAYLNQLKDTFIEDKETKGIPEEPWMANLGYFTYRPVTLFRGQANEEWDLIPSIYRNDCANIANFGFCRKLSAWLRYFQNQLSLDTIILL